MTSREFLTFLGDKSPIGDQKLRHYLERWAETIVGEQEDAEDVVQTVLARLSNNPRKWLDYKLSSVKTLLKKMVTHEARDWLRKKKQCRNSLFKGWVG